MFNNNQRGQTLMELIVVVAVSVIVVGALVFAIIASLRNAQFSKNQSQATKLAQEGIEKVRIMRDRNLAIINLQDVNSWNGDITGSGAFWNYTIYSRCGSGVAGTSCYFTILSDGTMKYIPSSPTFPDSGPQIPGQFQRAIIINDAPGTSDTQKTVTSIVAWKDFSGAHFSRLTTILRKIQ